MQILPGPEMATDQIDRIMKGEVVAGNGGSGLLVTAATFILHFSWVSGVKNQAEMGNVGICGLVVPSMTRCAGQGGVGSGQGVRMARPAAHHNRGRCGDLGCRFGGR